MDAIWNRDSEAGCFVIGRWPVVGDRLPVVHLPIVRRILEDGHLRCGLIYDESRLRKCRVVINREKFLRVESVLQNQDHTISIEASRVLPISISAAETRSHDFR